MNKKKILKRVKLRTILFLAIAISCNSFAWFVYNTKVSNTITTSVKAWRVAFENKDSDAIQYMEFDIKSIYPGMEEYTNYITVTNEGETEAAIAYELEEIRILNKLYTNAEYSQEELINMIENDYPFKIQFSVSTDVLNAYNGNGTFNVKVIWPFESGNDELDTLWGNNSYEFKQNYPDKSGIHIRLKLTVSQIN